MEIVLILVPVTLILVACGIFLFSWAVKSGQYDDLEGPAHRILYDDDRDLIPEEARQSVEPKPSSSLPQDSPQNSESKSQRNPAD